jgi:GNAT superfamily N-acetyltransferase
MIRRAALADAEGIFRVHGSAIRDVASTRYTAEQIEAWTGRLSAASYGEPIESKILFVAVDAGQICGFSQLDPKNSMVEAVYVLPSHLRQGLGGRLLKRGNFRSMRLLERLGFSLASPEQHVTHQVEPGESLMLREIERP